ncbi:MAG TPA: hypothetical protein VM533_11665 [Fimbriiglobus sp.]|nr:hypothetical protein [Fimbriiglobus sp.]
MRAIVRILVAAVGCLAAAEAQAQSRPVGRPPTTSPARPGGIGLPNPLSDPSFNWWYHHAPTYTRDGATYVVPPPWQPGHEHTPNSFWPYPFPPPWWNPNMGHYPYPIPPRYGPVYGGPTVINSNTVATPQGSAASPVTGQPVGPGDILVKLPTADAKVDLNGTALSGTGTDRHLSVSGVQAGARHEFVVTATWTADGKPTTSKRVVYLDGTGHGVADFTRPAPW